MRRLKELLKGRQSNGSRKMHVDLLTAIESCCYGLVARVQLAVVFVRAGRGLLFRRLTWLSACRT